MNPIEPSKALEPARQSSGPPPGRNVTARVFAVFASAWPNREVSEPTLNLWATQIGDVPADIAQEAAVECVRSCEFWPSVRTFLETVDGVKAARRREVFIAPELVEGRDLDLARSKVAEIRASLRPDGIAESKENAS